MNANLDETKLHDQASCQSVGLIPKKGTVVAIDGPAGTGKSSATKRLADVLGFVHIDTGALYRSIALLALEQVNREAVQQEDAEETLRFCNLARELARTVKLEFKRDSKKNPANRVLANGRDLTSLIRTPEVSMSSSKISAIPEVRASLLGLQRLLGCAGKTILEGRDIGTVVFPDADVKFFLNASADERAKRRLAELEAAGIDSPSFEEVKRQIASRDLGDMNRAVAPLKKAEDAIEIDTSDLTLDEVVEKMKKEVMVRIQSERDQKGVS